ncbi:hypothetical protein D6D23_06337 [Aureobasidium pullulans]|nr:hypothetical protein D6D23_06337 [Aureobasidium pullulans]
MSLDIQPPVPHNTQSDHNCMAENDTQASIAIPDQKLPEVTAPEQEEPSLTRADTATTGGPFTNAHEPFETFQHKVQALAAEQYVVFEDVHEIEGGSPDHRIIGLTWYNPEDPAQAKTPAVLRIPDIWDGNLSDVPLKLHPEQCGCGKHKANEKAAKRESAASELQTPVPTADNVLKEEDQDKSENVSIIDSEATTEYQASESSGESTDRLRWAYDWTKQEPEYELSDEFVFLNYLPRSQRSDLPMPKVLAFNTRRDNALGLPYSIQTRFPGVSLAKAMEAMSLEDKVQMAGQVAALQADMNRIVTKGSGRLMARNAKQLKQMRLNFQTHWLNLQEDIGIRGFLSGRNGIGSDRKAHFENVCHSLYSLLDSHLEASFRSEISEKHTDEDCIRAYLKLKDMFEDMENMGWFTDADKSDSDGVLHHWNLQARSIMVDQTEGPSSPWRITGVIDWDLPHTLPPVLTRKPPVWLWGQSYDTELLDDYQDSFEEEFDGDHDLMYHKEVNSAPLTAEELKIKERYEEVLIDKLYVQKYGDKAKEMYHDDAYGRGRWLRRIWKFNYEGLESGSYHLRRVQLLIKEWTAFKKANGIDDPTDKEKVIRVYITSHRPPSPSPSTPETSGVAEVPTAVEEVQVGKPAEDEPVENAAPPKKSMRNKASDVLSSFKCRPS